ncbi:type III-B CRISPR module-associated Cmr3 family protein [Pelagibius sp. CAU 1746]|uniref:type III-B CRISPR module-associated Cmr3 family protein n=1 Tax=Pelagibius sp. CAU 1746 TaxID=3140370 RepID=UPI00325AA4B5
MTEAVYLQIEALDTLMFRDGRPFNQADAGASEATSVFPPHPPSVVGAIRAALWRFLGGWDETRLGDGTNWQDPATNLGPLRFAAPVVHFRNTLVFPAPMHLVKDGEGHSTRLLPGPPLQCDLGTVRLPIPEEPLEGFKGAEDVWLTSRGLEAVLAGGMPAQDDWVAIEEIWQLESRVGIGIDTSTRRTDTTKDAGGRLYMASHVRLSGSASLIVGYSGWNGASPFSESGGLIPFAGEHRMAGIVPVDAPPALPKAPRMLPQHDGKTLYTAYLLSPCVLDGLGEVEASLKGSVVSACLGKAEPIGGWDSQSRCPVALRPALPAGSIWFMESDEPPEEILALHGSHIGLAPEWGFGQVMIGAWEDKRLS